MLPVSGQHDAIFSTVPLWLGFQWQCKHGIKLRQSKTDVFGVGVTIHLGRTGDTVCPVAALLAYLAIRPSTPGPLFLLKSESPLFT